MGPENTQPVAGARKLPRSAWVKGQKSPNPGGRPKAVRELVDACRALAPQVVRVLTAALGSDDERVQMAAVHEVCDRGWGKAPQAITGPDGEALTLAIQINLGGAK